MKKQSFLTDFRETLELLAPYLVLCAVMLGAFMSEGSWAIFFDKTLPNWLGLMTGLWLVMGLYCAFKRRSATTASSSTGDYEPFEMTEVNPATGLTMQDGFDSAGNAFGSDNFH